MSSEKLKNVLDIIERLKIASKSSSDAALARYLGVSNSRVSMWKKRGVIDLLLISQKFERISSRWLLSGEGVMFEDDDRSSYSNACKTAVNEPFKGTLNEGEALYRIPPEGMTKALGKAMCVDGIQEGDIIILDQDNEPQEGSLVLRIKNDIPTIERFHAGDPKPYAICNRLMRNLKQHAKPPPLSEN